ADVHRHLLGQVAVGDGGGYLGDVAHLASEVAGHGVHAVRQFLPDAGDAAHLGLAAQLPFRAHLHGHARHLAGAGVELVDHGVDVPYPTLFRAADVHRHLLAQVAVGDGGRHLRDVTDLGRQVAGHGVHGVGQVFPDAGHPADEGLTA